MPQAIGLAFAQAVGFIVGAGVPLAAVDFAIKATAFLALSRVTNKLFGPKVPGQVGLQARDVMSRTGLAFRQIVYGEAVTSGPIFYNNVSGSDNEYLWYAIALAEGQSEGLVGVYLDDQYVPAADIAWTAGTGSGDGSGTGNVSSAAFIGDGSTNALRLFYYLGSPDQPVSGILNSEFADIDTTHRGRGVTYLVASLLYNESTEEVWQSGPPNNIRAVIQGRRLYDPRLDSTNGGSGSHRLNDSSTWAHSDNPALCVADYLTQIMGVAGTSIDWVSIASAADDCDVSVTVPSGTETRFTCNGALSLGSSHKDNLDALVSSCDGKLSYTQGTWRLRASVWEASSVTINEGDIVGDAQVRGSAPKSERFNTVRGFFTDPDRDYEAAEFPHIESSAYVTRDDGRVIPYDLRLPMTNSRTMAERIAYRVLEQGDNQVIARLTLNHKGALVRVGDIVSVNLSPYSWTNKTFRCIEWTQNPDGTIGVVLKEDDSGDYVDPLSGEYSSETTGDPTLPSDLVPAPSALSASQVASGIQLDWTNPPSRLHDYIEVYSSTTNQWSNATRIARTRSDTYTHVLTASQTRYYWVRAIRLPDSVSIRNPDNDTSTITATSGSASAGADGSATAVINQYIRSATQPTTPGATSASYDFDTPVFTPTSGWATGVPADDGNPVWVSSALFFSSDGSGTDSNASWSTPARFGEAGTDGESSGAALNIGRRTSDLTKWYSDASQSTVLASPWQIASPSNAPVWPNVLDITDNADGFNQVFSERLTISAGKKYRVSVWARQPSGDRNQYLLVCFYDSAGAIISSSSAPPSDATGWSSVISYHYESIVNQPFAASWTLYQFEFGGNSSRTIPTGAETMAIGGLFQGTGTTSTQIQLNDFQIQELGEDGDDGLSVFQAKIYRRASSAPSTPTGGSYNFGTNTLTPPSGWSQSVPSGTESVYSSVATFSIQGTTGTDSSTTWSTPVLEIDAGIQIGDLPGGVASVDFSITPNNAQAEIRVNSNGTLESREGGAGGWTNDGTWIGNGANTDYEVKLVETGSGSDTPTGTLDTWQLCSTTRTWGLLQTTPGSRRFSGQLAFRRVTDNLQLGSVGFYMEAEEGN